MLIYRFRGGPADGLVGVADREPFGVPTVRGRQLVDERGSVIGRIIEDYAVAPPVVAAMLRRDRVPTPVGASAVSANDAAPSVGASEPLSFPDMKAWRRHVRAWAIEQELMTSRHRGSPTRIAVEAWTKAHGEPVIG